MKQETKTSFYGTEGIDNERFLILSDLQQQPPQGRLKVESREMRKTAEQKEYPVIIAKDEDGNSYTIAAWKRDCRDLIKQWGGEPLNWGYFVVRKGTYRFEMQVADDQTNLEEDVR